MPQSCTQLPHEVDHIRAQKHNGPSTPENLCWSCALCNSFKGSDVSAYTAATDELTRLFNPRIDIWSEHFDWNDGVHSHAVPMSPVSFINHGADPNVECEFDRARLVLIFTSIHDIPAGEELLIDYMGDEGGVPTWFQLE